MRLRVRILFAVCALGVSAGPARAADKPRRIAIMPFQNVNGGKELDSIGTGIAETLITELGRIPELTLVERSRLNDAQKEIKLGQSGAVDGSTAQKMGKFLGADGVVVGSFQKVGNTLRISARVIDVLTAQVRESTRVDGRPEDLLNLQDQLAAKLLEAMKGTLAASDRRRLGASPSSSIEALRAFSDGVAYYKLDLFQDAIAAFNKALALDPNYTDAQYYAGLAFGKLKRWDDAIAAFKRTLPSGQTEHTVRWSLDVPFDPQASRTGAYPTLDPVAGSLQRLLSLDSVVRARKRVVFSEVSSTGTVYTVVDPAEHRSSRLQVPEIEGAALGLSLASDRVVAIPVATTRGLLAGTMGIYGVSAVDGTQLWHTELSMQGGLPLGGFAGDVFWMYVPKTKQLVAQDELTLQKKWQREIVLDVLMPYVRIGAGNSVVAIAKSSAERKLHAIRMSDGLDAWSVDFQSDRSFHLVGDQTVVVFEPDHRLLAVDADSGKPLLDLPIKQAARMKSFGLFGSFVTVPAVINDNTVYFASDQNEIVAIDLTPATAAARRQRWKTPPQRPIRELAQSGGRIYATTDAGELLVVDAQSGAIAAAKIGGQALDLDYSGDDIVIVSSPDAVYGLRPETGARQWEYRPSARTKRPVYFKGTVIVETAGTSRIAAIDAETGGLLWQYSGSLANDGMVGDLGASVPKVMFGDDSVFIISPFGVREYALGRNAGSGISNKEALTELGAAYLEKGELDEAARFADVVAREFDPNYPPLRYLRSRIAQARGKPLDALAELLLYADLVGRQSKAGQEILADLKRTRGLAWTAEVGAALSWPLLADRKLVAGNDKQIMALDPANGRTSWRLTADRVLSRVYDAPSRRLFYAATENRDRKTVLFYSVDVANGERKEIGRTVMAADVDSVVVACAGGRLFAIAYAVDVQPQEIHVRVNAFEGASGNRLWEKSADLSLVQAVGLQNVGALFYPKGDSIVYSIGRDVLVVRGDDGTVRAQFTEDAEIIGRWRQTDDGRIDPDIVYFGTASTAVVGYRMSSKQAVVRTGIPEAAPSFSLGDASLLRDGVMYGSERGSAFAFDVRPETPDASRLKWRTKIDRDGRFFNARFVGDDLMALKVIDRLLVRLDPTTGKMLGEYPQLWLTGSVVEDGDRQYGFTSDGLAFALQLKPASK
jgi:outer membrane protein assembly factor BamB/TolB-like protein